MTVRIKYRGDTIEISCNHAEYDGHILQMRGVEGTGFLDIDAIMPYHYTTLKDGTVCIIRKYKNLEISIIHEQNLILSKNN